jgi:hypothetical protein
MLTVGDYNFFYGKGNENHQMGTGFFLHHRTVLDFFYTTEQY